MHVILVGLFVTSCLASIFISGLSPVFYELVCECSYPVSESLVSMIITWLINMFALIILFIQMIPGVGKSCNSV